MARDETQRQRNLLSTSCSKTKVNVANKYAIVKSGQYELGWRDNLRKLLELK